jgi:signal transduction histidine kinase
MSKRENPDIASTLAQALDAFNKSADKLSRAYRELLGPQSDIKPSKHTLLLGALESMPAGVVVTDREGRIVLLNSAAKNLTGLCKDDIIGKFYRDVVGADHSLLERSRSHSLSDIHVCTTPIVSIDGSIIGSVGFITAPERTPNLNTTTPNLAPVLAAIEDIIANIAHRMRSPLNAIQIFAELLKPDLDEDKKEMIEDILVGVNSLDAVLSNLLSFARFVKPDFQKVNILDALDESLLFAEPAIKQRGISLLKDGSHNELYCYGDLEQLKQVFFNLILNAIQAMPGGGELRITCSYVQDGKYADVKIQDNGCGIPGEHIDRVFTPFFTTKEGATGLGLCIVYRIIQAHNGAIQIDSEPGHGTTVSIQLPVWLDMRHQT